MRKHKSKGVLILAKENRHILFEAVFLSLCKVAKKIDDDAKLDK